MDSILGKVAEGLVLHGWLCCQIAIGLVIRIEQQHLVTGMFTLSQKVCYGFRGC